MKAYKLFFQCRFVCSFLHIGTEKLLVNHPSHACVGLTKKFDYNLLVSVIEYERVDDYISRYITGCGLPDAAIVLVTICLLDF